MHHELKIHPQYYARIADGSKTFEIRINDRGFQCGDTVELKEWNPEPINSTVPMSASKGFTNSPSFKFSIGYVHVLDNKTVVFSLLPFKMPKE